MTHPPPAHDPGDPPGDGEALDHERLRLLQHLDDRLEMPMVILGFAWLILLVIELLFASVWERNPFLETLSTAIWVAFLVHFAIELVLAPRKAAYFRSHWLTVVSLLVPALRVFRVLRVVRAFRAARAARGIRLLRVVTSMNRGLRALGASMGRRGFGYVMASSLVIALAASAGMYAFERDRPGGFTSYGEALWWTVMIMTTMGSGYWPQSPEGRVLCLLLALYAFAVFGYVTAALATFFVGRDAESGEAEVAGARDLRALQADIALLRAEVADLARRPTAPVAENGGAG
jgi:voltage-gated potassium channel